MFLVLSVGLALLAIGVFARKGQGLWLKLFVLSILGIVGVLSAIELGLSLITGEGVNDAVFYHLKTGLAGGDVSQYALPAIGSLVALALLVWLTVKLQKRLTGAEERSHPWNAVVAVLALGSVVLHPVTVSTTSYFLRFQGAEQYQEGFYTPDPEIQLPDGTKPKNLVVVYLESFERTYFDEERFPGLVPNLKALEAQALSFTNLTQTMGAGFTIGGMVASQCGVPLILSGGANSMRVNQFLSGADCVGDILAAADYETAYLGGASLEFAGKGAFYKTHGYDSVEGLDELRPSLEDPDYLAEWGLQDDTLFDIARQRRDALVQKDAPYVLTMLTLDTHHPNGHADTNKLCFDDPYQDGSNSILNSVRCDDKLAGQFIREVLDGPEGDNTIVVVMSDHIAMENRATEQLNAGPRRNLFFVIDGADRRGEMIDRPATTLDVGPTILSKLGFDVPRLGFGVDLQGSEPTLPEEMGITAEDRAVLDRYLLGFQSVYDRLWAYPDISDGLYTNLEKGEVQFGSNAFGTPVLLTFDETNAVSSATLGDARAEETLTQAVLGLADATPLMWIDDCRALEVLSTDRVKLKSADTCLAYGQRGTGLNVNPLKRSDFTPASVLQSYLEAEGDAYLASFEQSKLEEIGVLRGELAFNLAQSGFDNDGRGVLVQSAGFGAGASLIRRQTGDSLAYGEDWALNRGITLSGIDQKGRAQVLANVDQCSPQFSAEERPLWKDLIAENMGQYSALIVTVHDTAFCGSGERVFNGPLADLDLPKLKSSQMRQAYIGVIDNDGRIFEFLNETFPKLRVLLDPSSGEVPEFTRFSLANEPPVSPVQAKSELVQVTQQTAPVQLADNCAAPDTQGPLQVASNLRMDAVLRGNEMDRAIGFSSGWWPTESAGRWAGRASSTIDVVLPQVNGPLNLVLDASVFGEGTKVLSLWFQDQVLGTQELMGNKQVKFDVSTLPRETQLSLRFETGGAQIDCPRSMGIGADPRALNFMLKSVALQKGQVEPAPAVVAPIVQKPVAAVCATPDNIGYATQAENILDSGASRSLIDAEDAREIAFGAGWWGQEAFGRWIGDEFAEFELILPAGAGDLALEIEAIAFARPTLRVDVMFEGNILLSTDAGIGRPLVIDVTDLPRAIPVKLGFRLPNMEAACPALDGTSADTRQLRVMLQSIRLRSAPATVFGGVIAHAGGRLNGEALTNSFDALQANTGRYDVFEIDISWTADNELVCIHDWDESLNYRFALQDGPITRADFMQRLSASPDRPRNCDLDGLAGWMRANPDKRIVTDIKSNPLDGLKLIAERHPDILGQFLPQAYQPEEIAALKALGFEDVIWTLYRFPRDEQRIVQEALTQKPTAIAMPEDWALDGYLGAVRRQTGLPVLVHTINEPETAGCLKKLGAAAIYSDDLGKSDFSDAPELDCT